MKELKFILFSFSKTFLSYTRKKWNILSNTIAFNLSAIEEVNYIFKQRSLDYICFIKLFVYFDTISKTKSQIKIPHTGDKESLDQCG